jgi:hypothetical protein
MKKSLLIFIISLICSAGFAQHTNALQIKDLMIVADEPNSQDDPENIKYTILFKVNNIAKAQRAYLKLGTKSNTGNILDITAPYSKTGENYFLNYNSIPYAFNNYTSFIKIKVPKNSDPDFRFLTVYLEDKSGSLTQKLQMQIKP